MNWTKREEQLLESCRDDMTIAQIAELVGRSEHAVEYKLHYEKNREFREFLKGKNKPKSKRGRKKGSYFPVYRKGQLKRVGRFVMEFDGRNWYQKEIIKD